MLMFYKTLTDEMRFHRQVFEHFWTEEVRMALKFKQIQIQKSTHSGRRCGFGASVHFFPSVDTAETLKAKKLPVISRWTVYPATGLPLFALQMPQ